MRQALTMPNYSSAFNAIKTKLPVEGRDITRLLYRLPNVVHATGFYPEAPNVGINGANALFTNYLIDGMDNNEQFLGGMKFNIPIGFVQNINALTNNFSTEYGLTGNGIINITSRSGSNETSGEAFVVTPPGSVVRNESKNLFRLRELNTPTPYPLDDPANVTVRAQAQARCHPARGHRPGRFCHHWHGYCARCGTQYRGK